MRLLNSIVSRFLRVFFGFILFQYVTSDCKFPDDFPDGKVIYRSPSDATKTFAEDMYILKFKCSRGYQLIGRSYSQCVDKKWIPEIPFCAMKECSKPPDVHHATYEIESPMRKFPIIGSKAVYTCEEGYQLNETKVFYLRCVLSRKSKMATWRGKIPFCNEKKSCPDPGVSKFGKRKGTCCLSGASLHFSCNEEYELVGEDIIHCLPSGNWTSSRPLCKPFKVHCELPPSIPYGIVIGEKDGDYFAPNDEAEVLCKPGYKCEGPKYVYCEDGGKWESEFGECKEIFCDLPPPLNNGTILELQFTNLTSFPYNFELTYVCDKNNRLIGNSWRICDEAGWTGEMPTCEITQCPDPGIIENGIRMGNNYTVGSSVRVRCYEGYNLLGSMERYCLLNGQWSGDLARCDLPTDYCPNPGIPIKGSKNSTIYNLGSIIGFRCQDGYALVGSEVRECLVNHTWSGSETKCYGQYDFDSVATIREKLNNELQERAEEQKNELEKWNRLTKVQGKTVNVNFPGRIILYFMFDVSGSIGPHNFRRSIEFAKVIVKKVNITENGARAGALIFGSQAEVIFLPPTFKTTKDVLDALDNIEYKGGGTDANSAFTLLKKNFFPIVEEWFGKQNIKSYVFLITDGKANMGGSPVIEARNLKKLGVEIYCIGITGDIRKNTLNRIASKSKKANGEEYDNVYILENYESMSMLVHDITNGTIDYSQCGLGLENVGNNLNRGRIVGGETSFQSWPWMAALFMKDEEDILANYEHRCGGSIIHRDFILTAAHCLYHISENNAVMRNVRSIIIKLGLTDLKNETYLQEFDIVNVFIHPKFRAGNFYDYDIALLQIGKPAEFNAFVRPICLPPRELPDNSPFYKPLSSAWATGWGSDVTVTNGKKWKSTERLKEIYLPIQSNYRCIRTLTERGFNVTNFTQRMFCAGDGKGGNDTCKGDSGGPLMQQHINSEGYVYWTQVGIVSWGIDCGLPNTYGFYTYLQWFVPWIDRTIENSLKTMVI